MAIVMAGGIMGFGAALLGWLALDMSLLAALGLWVGSGPLSASLALALAARGLDEMGPDDPPETRAGDGPA